jgi:hypothetical protein
MCGRRSSARPVQRAFELRAKQSEIALDALRAADHYMIGAGNTFRRHDLAGEFAEAAFHAVADDRAADLFGDGEADAHRGVRILAVADEKQEAGCGNARAAVGGDEVSALPDRD